jgi:hypothetical protein
MMKNITAPALGSSPDEPATKAIRDNAPREDHIVCLTTKESLSRLVTVWDSENATAASAATAQSAPTTRQRRSAA